MTNDQRREVILNAVRRFRHLPTKTIARHILNTQGILFENNLDKIRTNIRYYRGQSGDKNRDRAKDKELFVDAVPMPPTWRKIRTPYELDLGLWLVIADIHVPFHEPKPIESAISYAQSEQVNGVLILGDLQDNAAVSFWRRAKRDFNAEIEATIDFLDFLRQQFPPETKIVYKPGNHEFSLPRYYITHAPELAESPLAAMETMLGFEERGIEFLDYHQLVTAGDLPMLHGHEVRYLSTAVNPARGLFLKIKSISLSSAFLFIN